MYEILLLCGHIDYHIMLFVYYLLQISELYMCSVQFYL